MNFNEKLQELRKQKGITQEELAESVYVSRAAVSKWESGRGYPSIDSLKALSKFFTVTIDELLSSDEVLAIAEQDNKKKEKRIRDLVFGILDISISIFLFMPFFAQKADGVIYEVSLLSMTRIRYYLRIIYFALVISMVVFGALAIAVPIRFDLWERSKYKISLVLSSVGILLFTVTLQPYAAIFLFVLLIIKALMLIKWR